MERKIPCMSVPPTFPTRALAAAHIAAGERELEERLTTLSGQVSRECADHGIHVLRLSGPSCAGKTTAARKLTEALEADGLSVYPISLDDFYYERAVLTERAQARGGALDYDSVDTLDLGTLADCVGRLLTKRQADLPVFDFATGTRRTTRHLEVPEGVRPVFLFEGIQAVYPQVAALFAGVPSRSVFANTCRSLKVGDYIFTPHRLRLMRRLVRDAALRGADPAFTLMLWQSVRANEKTSILPFAEACDYLMDTTVGYDVHILAPHLHRLLTEFPVAGENAAVAEELLRSIEEVEGIPSSLLPANSLYREFVPVCIDA